MSHPTKMPDDPKLAERLARLEKHDYRVEHVFRRILHNIERVIAGITLVILVVALAAGFFFFGNQGFVLLGCLAGYALALRKGFSSLDGMNGDISGYALTLSELAALAVWAVL